MPKPRAAKLETATARRRLAERKKPYWTTISPGIALGYRRNSGAGTWSVRSAEGGSEWIKRLALADDLEAASPPHVLSYWQALDAARALARRDSAADDSRPATVEEAIAAYEMDLEARGGDVYNARRARSHLPGSIRTKPVALLGATELCKWRDALVAKGLGRATVNRIRVCLRAALSLAAKRDRRIKNRHVWEEDLEALPNATAARNVVLADDIVAKLIGMAFARDRKLGLLCQVVGETGSRPSQVARLTVADLDAKNLRLLIPRSGKGHSHKRAAKMQERVPVPITAGLVLLLRQEAKGRAGHAPLLTRANGEPWGYRRSDQYRAAFRAVVAAAGLNPAVVTPYALRHSCISRSLLRGVPVTVVADLSDTSEREIRKHYAKLIAHHADEIARKGLLDLSPPGGDKVVALPGRRP